MKALQSLNKFFVAYKFVFSAGILITVVSQVFALYTPKLISSSFAAIEKFVQSGSGDIESIKALLLKNILLILATTLLSGFFAFLMRQTLIVMSRNIEYDLKNIIFKQYQCLSLSFYKKNRTGDLMNRISEDVGKVRMYVGPALMQSINTVIRFSVVITQMYIISPMLTLYTLLPLPILSYAIYKISKEISVRSTIFQQYLSKLSSLSQELFSGIRVIKAYGIEARNEQVVQELSYDMKDKNLSLARINSFFGPLMILLIGSSSLIVIYVGGLMYIDGRIESIGVIAEFIIYVNMLTWPVASIGWVTSLIKEAEASQERINEFLDIKPDIVNTNTEHSTIEGHIRFANVSLLYEDTNIQALKNISFEIKKGEKVVILGNTGSGKSTVLSLISRLYDTTDGVITVDDVPIKDVNLYDLRDSVGVVPQDSFLFSDSIKNNIKFGNETATDQEVIEAAQKANVHEDIISFTNQYETVLGERGITLSGGQKQRVSIARALIKKKVSILLFDDSLSAVDTETEKFILKNLFDTCKDKTTVIVSHRISTARYADKIIFMEDGVIIQQGTHPELIKKEGAYKELYIKQRNENVLL